MFNLYQVKQGVAASAWLKTGCTRLCFKLCHKVMPVVNTYKLTYMSLMVGATLVNKVMRTHQYIVKYLTDVTFLTSNQLPFLISARFKYD